MGLVTFGWIDIVCYNCAAGVNAGSCAKASGAISMPNIAANPKANAPKVTTFSFLPSLDITLFPEVIIPKILREKCYV
jgi:hypothetical protein